MITITKTEHGYSAVRTKDKTMHTTKHTPGKFKQASDPTGAIRWYEAQTGNYQGLIIEETTGKSVAVTYNKDHAAFIVAACNAFYQMREALQAVASAHANTETCDMPSWLEKVESALASSNERD